MAAAVVQSVAGAPKSQRLRGPRTITTALPCFVKLPPTPVTSLSYPFVVHSHRARDQPSVGGNYELSRNHSRVNAVTEIAEASGTVLRLENDAPPCESSSSTTGSANSRTFEAISNEEELLNAIRHEAEAKSLPPRARLGMVELYTNYRDAVLSSGVENARDIAVQRMATVLDRIMLQFEEPFTFPSYHKRMLEPYDYYAFGQNYIRPLIDYRSSYLGNTQIFDEMQYYVQQGHNVFVFANHQTEADPAVMALLLEVKHPFLAHNLTYIAGDRVVLDPFCKPFSMGRNLLCVHSKKHIYDVPELVDMKQRANARALMEMTALLKKGGQLIWIAPSGGRDRRDPDTGDWTPAPFDPAAVENMRRLLALIRVPGHMYPMALLCHDVMPPPHKVEKELGEKRLIGHTGVALSVASEVLLESFSSSSSSKEEAREKFAAALLNNVQEQYAVLRRAVSGEGVAAAVPSVHLSQPWLEPQTGNSFRHEHFRREIAIASSTKARMNVNSFKWFGNQHMVRQPALMSREN